MKVFAVSATVEAIVITHVEAETEAEALVIAKTRDFTTMSMSADSDKEFVYTGNFNKGVSDLQVDLCESVD
jgi:hypothetical protein